MKEFEVTIRRMYDYSKVIKAENEEEAEKIANEKFDNLTLKGQELFDAYETTVEEL